MNSWIILLLLCCLGHNHDHDDCNHSCGCRENNDSASNTRCENECVNDYSEQREVNYDRRENRGQDIDYCDEKSRRGSWQEYANYSRNESYNRSETCGCEEK